MAVPDSQQYSWNMYPYIIYQNLYLINYVEQR